VLVLVLALPEKEKEENTPLIEIELLEYQRAGLNA